MSDIEWIGPFEALRSPIMVAAWLGWNDAAESATNAVRSLRERWAVTSLAKIDPENFYDFTQARPTVHLVNGTHRALDWPQNEFWVSHEPLLPHDMVLFVGVEPHTHWRAYLNAFGEVIDRLDIKTVVTLGGLIADSTHTRPVPIAGFSNAPQYAESLLDLGIHSTNYEGPTGIVGVLSDFVRRTDRTTVSMWASVPPYVSGTSYPKASLALLKNLDALFKLDLDLADLDAAALRVDEQIEGAVQRNSEVREYIRRLERTLDEAPSRSTPPGSDSLFRELEDFLKRSREPGDDDPR